MLIRSLALSLMISSIALAQNPSSAHSLDYDRNSPLDIKEAGVEQRGDVAVHDISYASPKGGRVPAYLVVPSGSGPFAAVIWGHWYWTNSEFRNRKEFLAEAIALAHAGVVSLLTDGPIARPGHVENKTPLSDRDEMDLICCSLGRMSTPNGWLTSDTATMPVSAAFSAELINVLRRLC
jgi:hypothetical protein